MSVQPRPDGRGNRRAILFVLASSALFAVASVLVKAVSPPIPTVEIMLFRSIFALPVLAPLLWREGGLSALRTRHPWGHAFRTAAGFAGMFGAFYGYAHLPLAMATALGFAMPVFLAIMSVPLLGERMSATRTLSVAAGLVGVLVVLRPWRADGEMQLLPALVVLASVLAWAAAMISIRKMGQAGERNITIVAWFALSAGAASALLAIPVWVTPTPLQAAALVGVGLISGAAQLCMTAGYRSGEATVLAPFEYGAIFYVILFGWLFWGEVPGPWETTGIAFLVLAGLVTWMKEAAARPRPASTPPTPALPAPLASAATLPSPRAPARRPG